MTGFTIFCFVLLSISCYSIYATLIKHNAVKKYFYLMQAIWQIISLTGSILAFYLLALSGSGHHVETDLENILGEISGYLLLITILLSLAGFILAIIKQFKRISQ